MHLLPDGAATLSQPTAASAAGPGALAGPAIRACGARSNGGALAMGVGDARLAVVPLKIDPVASVLMTFLGVCLVRKAILDALLRRRRAAA